MPASAGRVARARHAAVSVTGHAPPSAAVIFARDSAAPARDNRSRGGGSYTLKRHERRRGTLGFPCVTEPTRHGKIPCFPIALLTVRMRLCDGPDWRRELWSTG